MNEHRSSILYGILSTLLNNNIIGQMPLSSDPRGGRVSIIVMLNSLNINFTSVHAV